MIVYKKGSLFDVPKGAMLIHAVSTKSVWGSGIAKEFKNRFPESFAFYKELCKQEGEKLIGTVIYCPEENGYFVTPIVTSVDYGNNKDPQDEILKNTRIALEFLISNNVFRESIYSNKFNSGLFGVPWEATERVLNEVLGDRTWIVMDPNLEEPK